MYLKKIDGELGYCFEKTKNYTKNCSKFYISSIDGFKELSFCWNCIINP